jgi:hypothetical protein
VGVGRTLRELALALGVLFAPLAAAQAAGDEAGFAGEVPGLAGKTWIDLLSQIFPDIAATPDGNAVASDIIDLRSIGTGDESWIKCADKIELRDHDAQRVHLAGRDFLVVTVRLEDECVGLIALFDDAGKLVDAVNVRGDIHISFGENYVRPLGANGALVIAHNWHDNSEQSYDSDSLILVKPDGFSDIGGVFAFGERDCGEGPGSQFVEEAVIRVVPDGMPMARIDAEVRRTIQKLAKGCDTKIGRAIKTTFDGFWRWNAAKGAYEAHTRELDLLDHWNEKHF